MPRYDKEFEEWNGKAEAMGSPYRITRIWHNAWNSDPPVSHRYFICTNIGGERHGMLDDWLCSYSARTALEIIRKFRDLMYDERERIEEQARRRYRDF